MLTVRQIWSHRLEGKKSCVLFTGKFIGVEWTQKLDFNSEMWSQNYLFGGRWFWLSNWAPNVKREKCLSLFLFLNLSFLLYLLKPITSFPLYLWVLYFICFILLYLILLISLFYYIYRILLYLSHSTVSFFFLLFLSFHYFQLFLLFSFNVFSLLLFIPNVSFLSFLISFLHTRPHLPNLLFSHVSS